MGGIIPKCTVPVSFGALRYQPEPSLNTASINLGPNDPSYSDYQWNLKEWSFSCSKLALIFGFIIAVSFTPSETNIY